MAQITVKYDPTLEIEQIQELMYATTKEEDESNTEGEFAQTKITGIVTPLIKVNHINIMWSQITNFELSSTDLLPKLSFTFIDDCGFVKSLEQPGNDNLVLVQILPAFEDAYKKINLRFYIDDVSIVRNKVTITAIYNVRSLYQYRIQAFGKMSTYDYLDKIAKECELGLASNIDGTKDEHYIYMNNMNYIQSIKQEISYAGEQQCIPDCWVDFHNYLVVCDMYERYNAIDKDLKVWTTSTVKPDVDATATIEPKQVDAIISNAIAMRNTQLFTNDYQVHSKSGNNKTYGTDRVLESYYMGNGESKSILIQDGDVKKDTFVKTIYLGEVFGDYDYFLQEACRNAYLRKIKSNYIEVALKQPVLGLERGQRVDFKWYEVNPLTQAVKDTKQVESNVPNPEQEDEPADADQMQINNQVSGQYLIIGTIIKYKGLEKGWEYILQLARPVDKKENYLDNE